jgi:hypothetical protein
MRSRTAGWVLGVSSVLAAFRIQPRSADAHPVDGCVPFVAVVLEATKFTSRVGHFVRDGECSTRIDWRAPQPSGTEVDIRDVVGGYVWHVMNGEWLGAKVNVAAANTARTLADYERPWVTITNVRWNGFDAHRLENARENSAQVLVPDLDFFSVDYRVGESRRYYTDVERINTRVRLRPPAEAVVKMFASATELTNAVARKRSGGERRHEHVCVEEHPHEISRKSC